MNSAIYNDLIVTQQWHKLPKNINGEYVLAVSYKLLPYGETYNKYQLPWTKQIVTLYLYAFFSMYRKAESVWKSPWAIKWQCWG